MTNNISRQIAFWIGCIGIRTIIVFLAFIATPRYLRAMGLLALVPAIGFFVIHFGGLRKTGIEVAPGGGEIWWSKLRPVHGTLYLLFAILTLSPIHRYAWIALAADVVIGVIAKLIHDHVKPRSVVKERTL
jgi:hypothetical protein